MSLFVYSVSVLLLVSLSLSLSAVKKTEARKRKTGNKMAGDASGCLQNETPEMVVESLHVIRTDFSTDALQKAVRFNMNNSFLVTGGVDGFIRIWEFPSMKKRFDFRAHDGEVEDVDISPDNKIVTVGRDFKCCVWKNDQLVTDLRWNENMPHISDKMYRYQACSDLGTFIGLGTVTGSVAIYIAFSLQQVYYVKETHGIVVTDLAFLPDVGPMKEVTRKNEAALLSVAVDSRCKLHLLPRRQMFPIWVVLLLCGLIIVLTIVLLQHLFPGLL
ncbi:hypothetical protein chiPu_0020485 [Chiloscyllium punctatum]|uniref:Uncharacterized protein n=1 Tax=Chiloscyllium punctatum TaxID=137246 RepID=A0A401RGA4_CHIPU|nr:hypothetical protein [Chiloscyllium punctatum]